VLLQYAPFRIALVANSAGSWAVSEIYNYLARHASHTCSSRTCLHKGTRTCTSSVWDGSHTASCSAVLSLSLQRNALCFSLCDGIILQLYATVPQTLGVLARASSPSKHVDAFSDTFELRAAGDTRIPRSITALGHIPGRHRKADTASGSLDRHAHCWLAHGKCWLAPTHAWSDMTSCRCYTAEGRGKQSDEEQWPKHVRAASCVHSQATLLRGCKGRFRKSRSSRARVAVKQ